MDQKKEKMVAQKNAEEICAQIRKDVAAEIEQVIVAARADAAKILEDARRAVHEEQEKLAREFDRDAAILRERLFSTVSLEKRKIILQSKSAFIEEVFTRARTMAVGFRQNPGYRDFLVKAACEGIAAIDVDSLELVYSPADEALVRDGFLAVVQERVRRSLGREISITVVKDTFSDIGCLVRSSDGHLVCDNRFMARFERMRDELRMQFLKEIL